MQSHGMPEPLSPAYSSAANIRWPWLTLPDRMKIFIVAITSLFAFCVMVSSAADAVRGKEVFDKRCAGYHRLDRTN